MPILLSVGGACAAVLAPSIHAANAGYPAATNAVLYDMWPVVGACMVLCVLKRNSLLSIILYSEAELV